MWLQSVHPSQKQLLRIDSTNYFNKNLYDDDK